MNLSSDEENDEFSSREASVLDDIDDLDDVEWEDASVGPIDFETCYSGDAGSTHSIIGSHYPAARATENSSIGQHKDLFNECINKPSNEVIRQAVRAKKKRRLNKFSQIPPETQTLLSTLHKSHLLIRTCHNILCSNLCSSDEVLLHISLSLLPTFAMDYSATNQFPTLLFLESFVHWFNHFTDTTLVRERRANMQRVHEARGAPNYRRMNKRKRQDGGGQLKSIEPTNRSQNVMILYGWEEFRNKLIRILDYLSPTNDENPEYVNLFIEASPIERLWIFVFMTRAMGWRVRYCSTISVIPLDLTPNHPLLSLDIKDVMKRIYDHRQSFTNIVGLVKPPDRMDSTSSSNGGMDTALWNGNENNDYSWVEILTIRDAPHDSTIHHNQSNYKWTHVDPLENSINQPMNVQHHLKSEGIGSVPIVYAIGVEHEILNDDVDGHRSNGCFQPGSITDITPRYSISWSKILLLRGATKKQLKAGIECDHCIWWNETVQSMNNFLRTKAHRDTHNRAITDSNYAKSDKSCKIITKGNLEMHDPEELEFKETIAKEPIPTSKNAFKTHPLYVIPSVLNSTEVLDPHARQRAVGFFKGERVFLRKDVSMALQAKQWLYRGRKVRESELSKPVRTLPGRKKPIKRTFKPLETYGVGVSDTNFSEDFVVSNRMIQLYGKWQTEEWSPPYVGPDDEIPVNEHKNVELALIPRGLIHLEQRRIAFIARKLAIPYAPCLVGFEGYGGNRTPMIRGIVVHESNEDILLEAYSEWESKEIEDEFNERKNTILGRWKRLVIAALTHDNLVKKYAND